MHQPSEFDSVHLLDIRHDNGIVEVTKSLRYRTCRDLQLCNCIFRIELCSDSHTCLPIMK